MKQNWSEWNRYWADCITLPFDHTHDSALEVSRSKFEIAFSQEWEGRLTWYHRDVSRPFMTMTLTFLWPWWGGWMYQIVTRVNSDIGVPSTYLINNIPTIVQIMAWHWPGNKPLPGLIMVRLLMHLCVTWLQWVNAFSWVFWSAFMDEIHNPLDLRLLTDQLGTFMPEWHG